MPRVVSASLIRTRGISVVGKAVPPVGEMRIIAWAGMVYCAALRSSLYCEPIIERLLLAGWDVTLARAPVALPAETPR